jgi:L-asparaginase
MLPRVALVPTGGTIDSIGASPTDFAWYYETGQRLDPETVVGGVPALAELADLVVVATPRLSSSDITEAQWLELVGLIRSLVGDGSVDGVVVTHGTNTMEETAYLLHLTVRSEIPVVLTGAMRPPSAVGTDAPANLLRAVQVAVDAGARGHGVLVVINDAIFAARDVTKTATYRLNAFAAPDLGPLGYADADNRVVFYHRHLRVSTATTPFRLDGLAALPRVDIVTSHLGADGALVDAAVAAGAAGIVCAGTGAGRPTSEQERALERARRQGVVICLASRVGSGRVALSPVARAAGWVGADNLPPWKARVLLALALTTTRDPGDIQRLFETL